MEYFPLGSWTYKHFPLGRLEIRLWKGETFPCRIWKRFPVSLLEGKRKPFPVRRKNSSQWEGKHFPMGKETFTNKKGKRFNVKGGNFSQWEGETFPIAKGKHFPVRQGYISQWKINQSAKDRAGEALKKSQNLRKIKVKQPVNRRDLRIISGKSLCA